MTWIWSAAFLSFLFGSADIGHRASGRLSSWSGKKSRRELRRVIQAVAKLEECLSSGVLPGTRDWDELEKLSSPWRELALDSIRELRAQGAALTPTLQRVRSLAENAEATREDAKNRSAQALVQAAAAVLLVPAFGTLVYLMLPELQDRLPEWIAICLAAGIVASAGALWIFSLADQACTGGLGSDRRDWALLLECSGERLISAIRAGSSPDLAWTAAYGLLRKEPGLAAAWGASVWDPVPGTAAATTAAAELERSAMSLRRAVQSAMIEGFPVIERTTIRLSAARLELRSRLERELALLPSRALKPLFACVAPALLGILAAGLALTLMGNATGGEWSANGF